MFYHVAWLMVNSKVPVSLEHQ